jgi:hypothetical protein
MWSHYADYHKGIGLCFRAAKNFNDYYIPLRRQKSEMSINYAFAGVFNEVIYNNGLIPQISPFNNPINNSKIISEQFLTKFKDWGYEKEYRIIHPEHLEHLEHPHKSRKILEYYPESLKGVIFGCRINKNDALRVYEAINKNNLSDGSNKKIVKYYKAEESTNRCEIKINPITDINEFLN